MNKKKWMALGIFFAIIIGSMIYFFRNEFPSDFLDDEALIKKLSDDMQVEVIQDKIFIDKKYVFVPFISKGEDYGYSIWKWENGKWHLIQKAVNGYMSLIKINEHDPASYRFVWNFPTENISTIKIFMVKDRNFHGMQERHYYQPRIQMGKSFEHHTAYGVQPFSGEMLEVYEEMIGNPSFSLESFLYPNPINDIYFAWNIYDENGEVVFLYKNAYASGGGESITMYQLEEEDLEFLE